MTLPQFTKFQMYWNVLKQITNITGHQINAQLYSRCDVNVQNSIINTVSDFLFSLKATYLMQLKELLPNEAILVFTMSHSVSTFSYQMKQYKTILLSCSSRFVHSCSLDINIWDHFIWELCNKTIQMDILARANYLKELESVIKLNMLKHLSQDNMIKQDCSQVPKWWLLDFLIINARKRPIVMINHLNHARDAAHYNMVNKVQKINQAIAQLGKIMLSLQCKTYFATVCCKRNNTVNALIAHVKYQYDTNSYTTASINNIKEITVSIQPLLQNKDISHTTMKILPDWHISTIQLSIILFLDVPILTINIIVLPTDWPKTILLIYWIFLK